MIHTDTDTESELAARQARLTELRSRFRREGSLAAALVQSMALAMICTAGAYPSWVLAKNPNANDMVLGASWAVMRLDPYPNDPLLGNSGAMMLCAIAVCCLFSFLTSSVAVLMDFLGRRRGRSWAPLFHGVTALLIGSSSACGSCLLSEMRGMAQLKKEYKVLPGQSLFLSFFACFLAAIATGLSCSSPARVQPARSSWDLGRTTRRVLRRPSPREEEEDDHAPERTPSLESILWQESRFSSFHMDASHLQEDTLHHSSWFDRTNRLRSSTQHIPKEEKDQIKSLALQKSNPKTPSIVSQPTQSNFQLPVPSPSAVEFLQLLHKDEAAPRAAPPERKVVHEESSMRGEDMTWSEEVTRQAEGGNEESETGLTERQETLWSDVKKQN